jgi:hypothetical protein
MSYAKSKDKFDVLLDGMLFGMLGGFGVLLIELCKRGECGGGCRGRNEEHAG